MNTNLIMLNLSVSVKMLLICSIQTFCGVHKCGERLVSKVSSKAVFAQVYVSGACLLNRNHLLFSRVLHIFLKICI